jgi:hypothetical protein
MICFLIKQARSAAFFEAFVKRFLRKKWGILIKRNLKALYLLVYRFREIITLKRKREWHYVKWVRTICDCTAKLLSDCFAGDTEWTKKKSLDVVHISADRRARIQRDCSVLCDSRFGGSKRFSEM